MVSFKQNMLLYIVCTGPYILFIHSRNVFNTFQNLINSRSVTIVNYKFRFQFSNVMMSLYFYKISSCIYFSNLFPKSVNCAFLFNFFEQLMPTDLLLLILYNELVGN